MALRNPYSEYGRTGDEDSYRREALVQALNEPEAPPVPPSMSARPRVPTRTPQQTRERLEGPGGRTQIIDRNREDGSSPTNAFSGDLAQPYADDAPSTRWQDDRQGDAYTPSATPAPTEAPPNTGRGRELLDAYDDPYDRRGGYGGSDPRRQEIAKGLLTSGNPYAMAAGALGYLDAWFHRRAKTAPTDFNIADAREIISDAHRDALGREITPEYLDSIVRGQGWEDGDRYMGQDSVAYVLDQFFQHAAAERAARGETAATPDAVAAAATQAGATPAGTGGGLPFSGFDFNRAQDPSKSAKDAFAAAAQRAPQLTDTSKAGAEAWFRQHIAPELEAAGYKVFDVQGDKAWIGSREDPEGNVPVDYLINAGGANPQIGWQPESGGGGIAGGTAANAQDAYAQLVGSISPTASKEEMEAAITAAFQNVPGFERAYKESVMLNGQWYDLVRGYGGAGAEFQGLTPKGESGGGGTAVPTGGGLGGTSLANLAPGVQLASPLGRSDVNRQIQEALQRLISGAPDRDALLAELGAG